MNGTSATVERDDEFYDPTDVDFVMILLEGGVITQDEADDLIEALDEAN